MSWLIGGITADAVLIDDHILIRSTGLPDELYHLDDRRQERNLADDPDQQDRLDRMRAVLGDLAKDPTD